MGADGWIAVVPALRLVVAGVLGLLALANRPADEDLAQVLRRLLAPLAHPLGIACVLLFQAEAALSLRAFGMLSRPVGILAYAPYSAFAVGMMLVAVYAAWLGIEVVAGVNAGALVFIEVPAGLILALFAVNHQRRAETLPLRAHWIGRVLWAAAGAGQV